MTLFSRPYATRTTALRPQVLHQTNMQLLHYLVFFLTSVGLSSYGASTYQPPGNSITVTNPNSVDPVIESHPHPRDNQALQCSLLWETEDFEPLRIQSVILSFLQRHANFHWFLRRHSKSPPPTPRFKVYNHCEPWHTICHELAEELPKLVPRAIKDINNWLYTSPYNGSNLAFCPRYPPVAGINIVLGLGYFDRSHPAYGRRTRLAYVPRTLYEDNSMYMYVDTRALELLLETFPTWRVKKMARYVITHELVHTLQHGSILPPAGLSALKCDGTPPMGLMEGIADFVALKAGEGNPGWPSRPRRSDELPDQWDNGYISTAYFLEWLEDVRIGPGAIGRLNDRIGKYGYFTKDEVVFTRCVFQPDTWKVLFDSSIVELWEEYRQYVDNQESFIYSVVAFVAHPATLSAFTTLVFVVLFFPLIYDIAENMDLVDNGLHNLIHFLTGIWYVNDWSLARLRVLLGQITVQGTLAVTSLVLFFTMNIWLWTQSNMAPFDAAVVGCFYGWVMWFMHKFADTDELRTRRSRRMGRLRGYDLAWEVYGRLLAVACGLFVAIVLWILRDMGIPMPVAIVVGLFSMTPFFFVQFVAFAVRICVAFIHQLVASLVRRTQGASRQAQAQARNRRRNRNA